MASATFSVGKPGEDAIELARLVERCLRGSGALDLEALCVLPGRKVSCQVGYLHAQPALDLHLMRMSDELVCMSVGTAQCLYRCCQSWRACCAQPRGCQSHACNLAQAVQKPSYARHCLVYPQDKQDPDACASPLQA